MRQTQATLAATARFRGTGLHSGATVCLFVHPAAPDTGLCFYDRARRRIWRPGPTDVVDTRLCTVVARDGHRIGTIEHLLAALAGCGIDNAVIEIDGPELPILDGSAAAFAEAFGDRIGEDAPLERLALERILVVTSGASRAVVTPARDLKLSVEIDYPGSIIGRSHLDVTPDRDGFVRELARARTFAHLGDVEAMRAAGLAKGGSLENAIVVDGARILNEEGLRYPDEFVRHKTLDVLGDLTLLGTAIDAHVVVHRPGHTINNLIARALARHCVQTPRERVALAA